MRRLYEDDDRLRYPGQCPTPIGQPESTKPDFVNGPLKWLPSGDFLGKLTMAVHTGLVTRTVWIGRGLLCFLTYAKEFPMPEESPQIHPSLRLGGWHIGDPFVILESILSQVEREQAKQITTMYLDSVAATLEANLKFVQGVRSVLAGANP